MILNQRFVFIIGAPRSGTTWLQAMIGSHPAVCTLDELKLFDLFTGPWEKSWKHLIELQKTAGGGRRGLSILWAENEFYDFLREFLERVYSSVLATKPDATIILDKTPGYSNYVEHINRLIPQAKFIHLIRDGRDVAASLRAASRGWGKLWAPKRIESGAHLWKSTLLDARKASRYGERYIEFRYEELLADGTAKLQDAFEFIGVSVTKEQTERIYKDHCFDSMKYESTGVASFGLPAGFFRKGQAGNWRTELHANERYMLHDTAGDLLCELGYADDSWWIDHAHQRFTLPLRAMLSSPRKARIKTLDAIKRSLGPAWTDRFRETRTWLKQRANKEIQENS